MYHICLDTELMKLMNVECMHLQCCQADKVWRASMFFFIFLPQLIIMGITYYKI